MTLPTPNRRASSRTLPPPGAPAHLRCLVSGLFFLTVLAAHSLVFAQAPKPQASASVAVQAKPAAKPAVASRPAWSELTPMQQASLKPLAASWDTNVSEAQKRKWLEISRNYPSLTPEGQATMHSRMNEWVGLSAQQRAQARLNFAKTKELSRQLTPEEKKAKWETYQALSPEEKQRLAAKATPKPTGAATAVKPVAPQKLAAVPPHPVKAASKPAPVTAVNPAAAPQR